jgi:hypothetical protein
MCNAEASTGRLVLPASMLREFNKIEATPQSAALLSISVQKPAQLFALPHKNGDPVPATLIQSSGELLGVSIR